MAILRVIRIRDGARSEENDTSNRRTYRYKVETDDATHDPDICWTSVLIPTVGSAILRPGLPTLVVKRRDAEHDSASPFVFVVTVEAETRDAGGEPPEEEEEPEPVAWDVNISIDGEPYEEPLVADAETSLPVVNSAGMAFDPPMVEVYFDERIEVSFKTNIVDQATIAATRGKVNSASLSMNINGYVRTFAARTLWLANARQSTVARPGGVDDPYWDVSYVLIYRADTWDRRPVDMGFFKKSTAHPGQVELIRDANSAARSSPSYLDGAGAVLADGAEAVRLTFKGKTATAFAPLFAGL